MTAEKVTQEGWKEVRWGARGGWSGTRRSAAYSTSSFLFFHRHLKSRLVPHPARARSETFGKSQKRRAMAKFPRFLEI